jgi:hypothetical protein
MNYPTDEHAKAVCKIGQGAACCRYLTMGSSATDGVGWSCEKATKIGRYLDQRVADEMMNARGDNCEGLDSRQSSFEPSHSFTLRRIEE